jgi:predicted O-methyltransferase YrrM
MASSRTDTRNREPRATLSADELRTRAAGAETRADMWVSIVNALRARDVAEIGVYRGDFAARLLRDCPTISRYYMVDPWRHLDDWNKPANRADDVFERFFQEVLEKTRSHEEKRVVLRGRTSEVIDQVPDDGLDFAYIDGDHTLRGITIDLVKVWPKVRQGGFVGGDDFRRSIWQHGERFEPTLVFPFAVFFAEAVGGRAYGLPKSQFLIEKGKDGYAFVDLTGKYRTTDLRAQLAKRNVAGLGARLRRRLS